MTDLDERASTVAFFQEQARGFVDRPVVVELVTMATGARLAVVYTDGQSWRVLAHDALPPRLLLFVLFHELGHVVNGDVSRVDPLVLEHVRAAVVGDAGLYPAAFRSVLDERHDQEQEDRADRFAEEQASRCWPVLKQQLDSKWNEHRRGLWYG